jgi:hypothetical protein
MELDWQLLIPLVAIVGVGLAGLLDVIAKAIDA